MGSRRKSARKRVSFSAALGAALPGSRCGGRQVRGRAGGYARWAWALLLFLAPGAPFAGAQPQDGGTIELSCLHFKIRVQIPLESIPEGDCAELGFDGASNPFPFSAAPGLSIEGGLLYLAQPLMIDGNENPLSGSVTLCPGPGLGPQMPAITWVVTNPPGQIEQERCEQSFETTVVAPTEHRTNNTRDAADPVSLASGELHDGSVIVPDLRLGGPLPLNFLRFYGSLLKANGVESALGANWMHNFDVSLERTGPVARVRLFGGRSIRFRLTEGAWALDSAEKLTHQLQGGEDTGYRFLDLSTELVYSFDAAGRLIRIEDRNGNALEVTQAAGGIGPSKVEDGLGRSLEFTYTQGKLTKVEDQTGRAVVFTYTDGNLTGVTDPLGRTENYEYPASGEGLLLSTTKPDGAKATVQRYDASGRVIEQDDGEGNTLRLGYDVQPGAITTTQTDALNRTATFRHARFNNLAEADDPAGAKQLFSYDASNRLTSYTNANGDTARFSYHPDSGYFASSTDYQGRQRTVEYEMQTQDGFRYWVATRLAYPDGTEQLLSYDARGNLTGFTDRAGNRWSMTVNGRGQVLENTNPAGGTARFTYNDDGTLARVESATGIVLTMEYDALKRLSAVRDAEGGEVRYAYDAAGNLLSAAGPAGRVHAASFDANGRMETFTDSLGNQLSYSYDANGRLLSTTDSEGNVRRYETDAAGQLVGFTNGAGETLQIEYDGAGRRVRIFDALGTRMRFAYDAAGRLRAVTDALNKTRALSLDEAGRPVAATAAGGERFTFRYDSMGRLEEVRDPLGRMSRYSYSAMGDLTGLDRAGIAAQFQRDARRNITAITDPNGGVWRRGYDSSGALTSVTDPLNRVIRLGYDRRGNVSRVETPLGVTTITSDPAGRPTQRTMPDGSLINLAYDADGRLTEANGLTLGYDRNGRLSLSNGIVIERDAAGRVSALTPAPGKRIEYEYDARGRVTRVSDWVGGATTLSYDAADRLASIRRPNGVTTEFTYDANDRLTKISERKDGEIASITLTRDAAGQITAAARNLPVSALPAPGVMPVSYDPAHQMTGATYDALGRLISDGLRQYTWDHGSRLIAVAGQGGGVQFTYDGLGGRISRSAGGETEEYVLNYALPWTAVSIVRSGGADRRYYVHLPNGVLLHSIEADGESRRFYHFDEMGNTTLLTGDAGAVTDAYAVTPYGEHVAHAGSSTQPFVYHGAYGVMREGSTDLYYMRARYYDAGWGRFLTRDPVLTLDPLAVNPYQFAGANPLFYIDPTGRRAMRSGAGAHTQPRAESPVSVPWWMSVVTGSGGLFTHYADLRIAPYVTAANSLDDWVNAIVNGADDVWRVVDAFNPSASRLGAWAQGVGELDPRFTRWTVLSGQVDELAEAAKAAQKFKWLGNGLAALGVAVDTGQVIYDGVQHGDGGRTVLDAGATAGAAVSVLATGNLALGIADVATGGAVTGGLTNTVVAADAVVQLTTGRFTPADAEDVRRRMTRKPGLSVVWDAGESWADRGIGGTFRALGQAFGLLDHK